MTTPLVTLQSGQGRGNYYKCIKLRVASEAKPTSRFVWNTALAISNGRIKWRKELEKRERERERE